MSDRESKKHATTSGIEFPVVPSVADLPADYAIQSRPGEYPYMRGIYPEMYSRRLWTMRQYAGFGSASETNKRFRHLLAGGQTGLSVAFDLPTQIGYDSDDPMALGEVGKTGVAIDTLSDMEELFEGIPLGKVSTSMTINATAAILLAMYVVVARKQGVADDDIVGTVQNDILKEFIARGTYIFPPVQSMRIVVDIFAFTSKHLPRYNSISISGYHIREAGSTAVEEVAFTLANAIAYVENALNAGLDLDKFAPRLSFFFAAHNNLFEEVAKFRAARRIWAEIVKERFKSNNRSTQLLRFHTQTGGSTLTAQQPENNIVRTTIQALAATLGGTQSLHTNSFDEALGLPTVRSAEIALRTQQIIAEESGISWSADPLAGSYLIEKLTWDMTELIRAELARIDEAGGAVACVESGYFRREIATSAYEFQKGVESGENVVIGLNKGQSIEEDKTEILKVDAESERLQCERIRKIRKSRDQSAVDAVLGELSDCANSSRNILPSIIKAVELYTTVGEISNCLRESWGEYHAED